MATDFEVAIFEQQLRDVSDMSEAERWVLERDESIPLEIFATMHSVKQPEEQYKARFRWTDLFKAPSMKFIDLVSGSDTNPCAWPRYFGFRPACLDACLPWTAEGQHLHPEWAQSVNAFPKVEVPVQFALMNLQFALDTSYEGRGSP